VLIEQRFASAKEVAKKATKGTERGIEKWFPGMLQESLQMTTKLCHCQRQVMCKQV
jgi:hypothetical protein